ncbi:GNAT family N-acetyltransferase [Halobacillus litoralis]|uniref:GNAT family N-acetyltransferase n=1 Tax=Halobacillus litoralis TaxID=45668 RepID=UPI001CFDE911|nr:GNAT family protein [Halobacillus litoralis]
MGLGLAPALTGKGKGKVFCGAVLDFIEEKDPGIPIRLSVATFNRRAIRLYRSLGFVQDEFFYTDTHQFMTMIKK